MARCIVRAVLTSDLAVGASALFRLAQMGLVLYSLGVSRDESCDNVDLLRVWLGVYALRCLLLAHLLYRRHGLYKRGATAAAGGAAALAHARARAEHAKSRLDSLGTVWSVMGALWLFGSGDCGNATGAPLLSQVTFAFLLMGFFSLFLPLLFFGLLCCCLPPVLAALNAYHARRGTLPETALEDTPEPNPVAAWIAALPCDPFHPAPPPGSDAEAGCMPADAEAPPRPASPAGSEGAPVGGFVGKRYLEAEDAACVICLGAYSAGGPVRSLPCTHHFHGPCFASWLQLNASCPLCKAAAGPPPSDTPPGDSAEDLAQSREAYLRAAVRGGDDLLSVLV